MTLAGILDAALDAVRPLARLSPSEWAQEYRDVATKPYPGEWDNENAPYLVDVMDAPDEARARGLLGFVLMKSAQGGGSEAMLNVLAWCLTYYPGPYLYLTSRDETADEFSRDRVDHLIKNAEPLRKKHLAGKAHGEKIAIKRFTDSKLTLRGGRSPNNYISDPYRGVDFDELDSIMNELADGSDPVATINERMSKMREAGATFLRVFGHPTTDERGTGYYYHKLSDMRRGHVECPHCRTWWAPRWKEHVKVFPGEGQSPAAAKLDASCYVLVTPCCGVSCTEADRQLMIRNVRQLSTLPPAEAAKRRWLGVHFWQFFYPSWTIRDLAEKYCAALRALEQGDESQMITWVNKTEGDVYKIQEREVTVDTWKTLALEQGQPHAFARGTVPPEVVWLTSGQDSKETELHWTVWGWGYVRSGEGLLLLCRWLIDWGIEEGPNSAERQRAGTGAKKLEATDLAVFDGQVYGRAWPRVASGESLYVFQGFHDSGWWPQAAYGYCKPKVGGHGMQPEGGAFPSRGANETDHSNAPHVAWVKGLRYRVGDRDVVDESALRADLNTYTLKTELFALAEHKFTDDKGALRNRISLPYDVAGEVLDHLASEKLKRDKRGHLTWEKRGPNHFLDCTVMASAAAWNSESRAVQQTRAEVEVAVAAERAKPKVSKAVNKRRPRGGGPVNTRY